ncbi:MAG: hypothetical protein AB7G25_07355 [Sphingomonadaceae bacterium]
MDLNYLMHREAMERVAANRATSDTARDRHQELADRYRAMIDAKRVLRKLRRHVAAKTDTCVL